MSRGLGILAIGLGLLTGNPALAEWQVFDVGLTEADIDLAQAAAREGMDGQPAGTVLSWENPATGANGTVELVRIYQNLGFDCRELLHRFHTEDSGNNTYNSSICLTPDGWKFDD